MTAFRRPRVRLLLITLVAALLVGAAAPRRAEAHSRVFIGIGPGYSYPYSYPYSYYPPPPVYYQPVAPWVAWPDVPPPGWVPGHWERHHDRSGRPYDVWVPPHLR
jgi:hypothetical protein